MRYSLKAVSLLSTALVFSVAQATTQGHVTIVTPTAGAKEINYTTINGYAVTEGDIIVAKHSQLQNQGAVVSPRNTHWPKGLIAYEIDKNFPFKNKLSILQAIDHWQQKTPIQFVELNESNRKQYPDYISFIPVSGTTCSSWVGRQGGPQEINLAPRCTTMNTVHEIGHALGLWHEQSRADRNQYIRIAWENIEEASKFNFDQHLNDGEDIGEYDYGSIMHYGTYAFSKNGQKTIIPLIEGVEIGQRNGLSDKDIAAIISLYSNN